MRVSRDRYLGLLMGHHLGDALGAQYELGSNKDRPYHGILEYTACIRTRWQGTKVYDIGTTTDDTGLAEALLDSLALNKGVYVKDDVLLRYMSWCNSGKYLTGINTGKLLKGVKTLKGYYSRWNKIMGSPDAESIQSNGSLMRCQPLALLDDLECFKVDCALTNISVVNLDCSVVYGLAIWMAVRGYSREQIACAIPSYIQTPELREIYQQAFRGEIKDTTGKTKGWVGNAMYHALMVIYGPKRTYREVVDSLASVQGDDTDTNTAIAGGLAGALDGYQNMIQDKITRYNLGIIDASIINNTVEKIDMLNLE